jgi:hypothetical protein
MATLPNQLENVAPGQMNRDEIRKKLGNPLASSRYWGFDLFQEGFLETSAGFVAYFVFGTPVYNKQKHYRYTLVRYDDDGVAQAIDSGYIHTETEDVVGAKINLLAKDITFIFDSRKQSGTNETLFVWSPEKRDAYLQFARSAPTCTLVAGCTGGHCFNELSIDGEPSNFVAEPLPVLESQQMVALSLKPGTHDLGLSIHNAGVFFDSKYSLPLSCKAGEIVYLTVKHEQCAVKRCNDEAKLSLHQDMPDEFANYTLQLWGGGKWLVNPEPGN